MVRLVVRQGHFIRWYRDGRKQLCPFTHGECIRECASWCPMFRCRKDNETSEVSIGLSCGGNYTSFKVDDIDTKVDDK